MNTVDYILAIDPGNEKSGLAVLSHDGELMCRTIVVTKELVISIERVITDYFGITHMVCGNGTNHKRLYPMIQQMGRNHRITTSLIDESHSTEEARKLYWQYNPPTGWRKLVPKGMQFPPEPIDDLTAYVIGMRYTKQLQQAVSAVEETINNDELEAKRLDAIQRLYNEGDNNE